MAVKGPTPQVILEDDSMVVLDKPAGMLSHADPGRHSLLEWARAREAARGRDPEQLSLVHRLDRDTSGVIVLGRDPAMTAELGRAFRQRQVLKMYIALTWPVPAVRWGRVEHQLVEGKVDIGLKMEVVLEGGRDASSEVEVVARGRRLGMVRVIPEQGRRHQVRVALADFGAPIAGDFLYGGTRTARMAPRIMLHARALEIAHPRTGEHLRLHAPLPADMLELFANDGGLVPTELDQRHLRKLPTKRRPSRR